MQQKGENLMQQKLLATVVIVFVALALLLSASQSASSSGLLAPAAPLPKPADIACEGYERDTVLVYWRDTATDETNYRIMCPKKWRPMACLVRN